MRRAQPDYVALTAAAVLLGVAAEAVRKQPHLPPSVRWTLGWVPSFAFALGIVSFDLWRHTVPPGTGPSDVQADTMCLISRIGLGGLCQ